jgi:hypothetical protein
VQLAKLVVSFFPQPVWCLIFDDTFIYRSSKKAPGSGVYHQHGNKTSRPQYTRGQGWVIMALSIGSGIKHAAVPLLSRLMRTGGNRSKLDVAGYCSGLQCNPGLFAGGQLVYEVAAPEHGAGPWVSYHRPGSPGYRTL